MSLVLSLFNTIHITLIVIWSIFFIFSISLLGCVFIDLLVHIFLALWALFSKKKHIFEKGSSCCLCIHVDSIYLPLSVPYLWTSYFVCSNKVCKEILLYLMHETMICYDIFRYTLFICGIEIFACTICIICSILLWYVLL